MKQYIKSYSMFFPNKIFEILFNILFPVIVLLVALFQKFFINNSIFILLMESLLIISGESLVDFYIFGGIAKRDSCRNEYLKTSVKYTITMKKAFIADAVRRLITIMLIIFLSFVILQTPPDITIFLLLSVYFFTAVSLCVLRFIEDFTIEILINSAICIIYTIFFSSVLEYNLIHIVGIVIFVLSIFIVTMHIKFLNLRIKEEYYDSKD